MGWVRDFHFMLRLISGVTVYARVCSTPKLRSFPSSPFLIFPSISRSVYITPGYLTGAFKARRKMTEVIPQTRPLSEVEADPSEVMPSVGKKPRLDIEVEPSGEQPVASTSTTTKREPARAGKKSEKKASKKKKKKQLPPELYSHDDVLWRDVRDLLGVEVADGIIKEGKEWESPFQYGDELEVEISAISSTGAPLPGLFPSASIGWSAVLVH